MVGKEGEPEFAVWDKEIKSYRPVSYRDMAILLRSPRIRANTFLEVFREFDIPIFAQLGTGYFQAIEIHVMLSLLQVIDNPRQDIPLAAVLRSPLVGLTARELAEIRAVKIWGLLQLFWLPGRKALTGSFRRSWRNSWPGCTPGEQKSGRGL